MKPVSYISLLRPHQWLKNLILLFPPFLSGSLFHAGMETRWVFPFVAFCCASSSTYIINDIIDRENDLRHPVKRFRPIPSGRVSGASAFILSLFILSCGVVFGLEVSVFFLVYVSLYLCLSLLYSILLKNLPIVDIFCISSCFVIRLYAGGEAFDVQVSSWLFLTVFLLAIFLCVGKRYSERRAMGASAAGHRRILEKYPAGFLEGAMYLSGAAVLVTYSMYVITRPLLVYTVPLCLFGLLRYLLNLQSGEAGDPTEALIKDGPLLMVSLLWVMSVGVIVYQ